MLAKAEKASALKLDGGQWEEVKRRKKTLRNKEGSGRIINAVMVLVLKWLFTIFNKYLVSNFVTNSSPASTFMFIYASNSDLNEKMPCTGGISLQGDKV